MDGNIRSSCRILEFVGRPRESACCVYYRYNAKVKAALLPRVNTLETFAGKFGYVALRKFSNYFHKADLCKGICPAFDFSDRRLRLNDMGELPRAS